MHVSTEMFYMQLICYSYAQGLVKGSNRAVIYVNHFALKYLTESNGCKKLKNKNEKIQW